MDGRDVRSALRLTAHALNSIAGWRQLTPRQHMEIALEEIDKEMVGALGSDHLADAAARLLLALELRERERQPAEASPKLHGKLIHGAIKTDG